MHHIETVTVTVKGLSAKPKTYTLSRSLAEELDAYLEARIDQERIPADEVFPVLKDDVARPATMLRGARYRAEMTQKQLADILGIRQHHLSEMENAKRGISKDMATKLGEVLNINRQVFL